MTAETPTTASSLTNNDPQRVQLLKLTGDPQCLGVAGDIQKIEFTEKHTACHNPQCPRHSNCVVYYPDQEK